MRSYTPVFAMEPTKALISQRHAIVLSRIVGAGGNREVCVVAVTKTFSSSVVEDAVDCGITDIGESYAQECVTKLNEIPTEGCPRVHFVGRLQSNKIKSLSQCVDVWQSVDRGVLINKISRYAPGSGVMIQVNLTDVVNQGGCRPVDVEMLASQVDDAKLKLLGLMTIGPRPRGSDSLPESRSCFKRLRHMVDVLGLQHCSMGMSSDLEIAVGEGSTMVRVGHSLFGSRF